MYNDATDHRMRIEIIPYKSDLLNTYLPMIVHNSQSTFLCVVGELLPVADLSIARVL